MQILTIDQLNEQWSKYISSAPKTIDLETNAKEVWHPEAKIVTISMAGINAAGMWEAFQIPIAHREGQNAEPSVILRLIELLDGARLIPFWVPMESAWLLAKYGIRPVWVGDAYYIARIAQLKEAGLKDLSEKFLQRKPITYEEICPYPDKDFSRVHAQDPNAIKYTEDDAINAGQLETVLRGKYITPHNMQAVYELEIQTAAMMAEYNLTGYAVDMPYLEKEIANEGKAVAALETEIFNDFGVGKFTINSGPQLGKALLAKWGLRSTRKTEKGADSWAKEVIQDLIAQTRQSRPEACLTLKKVVEFKTRASTLNTLRHRSGDVSPDGRLHPSWLTIGFDGTSRMYSQGPSMTSLPKAARKAFRAPEGKRWVKFDWRQAEVRILAALSGDKGLIEALSTGDYHRAVYSRMSGVAFEDVTPTQRESSKVITYSILYSGGNAWHVAQELGISEEEAAGHVRKYFEIFPVLGQYLSAIRYKAAQTFHVRSYMNRLRRLEGGDARKAMDQACNAMGQQSCGTLLKIALMRMHHLHLGEHQLMSGFDEVIPVFDACYYLLDERVPLDKHIEVIRQYIEVEVQGEATVKLEAEFEEGTSWGELMPFQVLAPSISETNREVLPQPIDRLT